ncbi:unnamed protein product [Linum trigynum]|uniref:Uncharacterized protein n=1 Tax=Linum trigynum TaxID=586398 RepID=A0AAV2E281_9ROSI
MTRRPECRFNAIKQIGIDKCEQDTWKERRRAGATGRGERRWSTGGGGEAELKRNAQMVPWPQTSRNATRKKLHCARP